MNDICIVDVYPGDESGSIQRIRELIEETRPTSVAFMVTAVPNEQPLDDGLADWVRRFRMLQEGVGDLPVQVGILIQALIGHGDRNRIVGELPFQTIVGSDGTACRESFCPLDPGFQEYTRQLIRTLAETAPAYFMIDDDFRIRHHDPANNGCMCSRHMERFSERLGRDISRGELVARFHEAGCGEMLDQWEQLREDSLVELAQVIRDSIDEVDDGIPGMYCCVAFEAHLAPAITDTLAGRHRPQVRINNANYLEQGHKDFPRRIARTFSQIAEFSKETVVLTEADTYPHSRYSLSVKSHLAHVTATILAGCRGAKYWYCKTDKYAWRDTAAFRQAVADAGPFIAEVEAVRDDVIWEGPVTTAHMREVLRKPWSNGWPIENISDDWGWRVFGRMGIPYTYSDGSETRESTRTLCRTAPLAYGTDDILHFLSGPLLLDGEAAWHLCEMGFAEHLGVSVRPTSEPCAYEVFHPVPNQGRTEEIVVGIAGGGRYELVPNSEETSIVSSFVTGSPASYSGVGPALTWHRNTLGGRVAVYGLSMNAPLDLLLFNSARKRQLVETLTWLADGSAPVMVDTDLDVYAMYGRSAACDEQHYVCLFNLNPDTLDEVRLMLPASGIVRVDRLAGNGLWEAVDFTSEEGALRCGVAARTMEPLILRLQR